MPEDIPPMIERGAWFQSWRNPHLCRYRIDPVPRTRPRRGGSGSCFRYPRTQPSRRMASAHLDEGFYDCKAGNLPTAYDDIIRRPQHSWKAHRRTQYRAVVA